MSTCFPCRDPHSDMAYILMMKVLANFDRDELEIVSITSRLFANVIKQQFSEFPLRVFKHLDIHASDNGAIELRLKNFNVFLLQDGSNVQEFRNGVGQSAPRYFSLDRMRPYIGESVRFKQTKIEIGNFTRINNGHVTEMEAIAHLWLGKGLCLIPGDSHYRSYSPVIAFDCHFILSSKIIITSCREFSAFGIDFPFSKISILYNMKVVRFIGVIDNISPRRLIEFIDGIHKHQSKTMIVCDLHGENSSRMHIGKIRQAFEVSLIPSPYDVIFVQSDDSNEIVPFRHVNCTTGEELKMCPLKKQKKNYVCSMIGYLATFDIFALQRKKIQKH